MICHNQWLLILLRLIACSSPEMINIIIPDMN